jgi:hypothetical protein
VDLKLLRLRHIDFINQRDAGIVFFGTRLDPLSRLEELKFIHTRPCYLDQPDQLAGGFTDADGSLKGNGIPVFIHGKDPLAMTPATAHDPALNAWVTPLAELEYLSLTDPRPSPKETGFTLLSDGTNTGILPDMRAGKQGSTHSGYLKKNVLYTVRRFDPLPDGARIATGDPGDRQRNEAASARRKVGQAPARNAEDPAPPVFVQLGITFTGPAYVYEETHSTSRASEPDVEHLAPQAMSLAQFATSPQLVWYAAPATQSLYLRLQHHQAVYVFHQPVSGLHANAQDTQTASKDPGYPVVRNEAAGPMCGAVALPAPVGLKPR